MSNTALSPKPERVMQVEGVVVFRSRTEKRRFVLQPAEGKRAICEFDAPVSVRVRQSVAVVGRVVSEGATAIVLVKCSFVTG